MLNMFKKIHKKWSNTNLIYIEETRFVKACKRHVVVVAFFLLGFCLHIFAKFEYILHFILLFT
jgi:hypothetical protein